MPSTLEFIPEPEPSFTTMIGWKLPVVSDIVSPVYWSEYEAYLNSAPNPGVSDLWSKLAP